MTIEEAKKEFEKFVRLKTTLRPLFVDVILQALEAEPRKHGRWIKHGIKEGHLIEKYTCSECDFYSGTRTTNYCPNCGAKMDEVEE